MRIVEKPWGYEEIFVETPNYVGKVLFINPGHRLSKQYHNFKEETFRVIKGTLLLELEIENDTDGFEPFSLILKESESYHCPPETIHRMGCPKAFNSEAVQVVEVSTNHLDDVVRLEDDYKR